jgi:hypothetical protein
MRGESGEDVLVRKHLAILFRSGEPLLSKNLHCQQWISRGPGERMETSDSVIEGRVVS